MRPKAYVDKWLAAWGDENELARLVTKRRRLDNHNPPRARGMARDSVDIDGFALHYLRIPQVSKPRALLYLHGGGYVIGPTNGEWRSASKLAAASKCDLVAWDYPRAPEHDCEITLATTMAVWDRLVGEYGAGSVAVVGASAGGGLAASVLVRLRNDGQAAPAASVLFSPWLDLSLGDPRARELEAGDLMLSIDALRRDGRLYAGERDLRDPVVSPLYADPRGLGPMQVHVGTSELLLHDCTTFADRIVAAGGSAELVVDPLGQHVSALFPTPEGKRLRRAATDFVCARFGR